MLAYTFPIPHRLTSLHRVLAVLALAAVLTALLTGALRAPPTPVGQRSANLPLIILPTDHAAAPFSAFGVGDGVAFQPDGLSLKLANGRLGVRFVGARPEVILEPTDTRDGTISRHVGAPSTWRDRIPTYAALTYRGLFPGVDLRYDGWAGNLKGTYVVAPRPARRPSTGAMRAPSRWRSTRLPAIC